MLFWLYSNCVSKSLTQLCKFHLGSSDSMTLEVKCLKFLSMCTVMQCNVRYNTMDLTRNSIKTILQMFSSNISNMPIISEHNWKCHVKQNKYLQLKSCQYWQSKSSAPTIVCKESESLIQKSRFKMSPILLQLFSFQRIWNKK